MVYVDKERLTRLLRSFYALSGIRMALLDLRGRELTAFPEKRGDFCALVRTVPEIDQRCAACDESAFAMCRRSDKPERYKCHAGLTEVISPISRDGAVLCYAMFGQVLEEETADRDKRLLYDRFADCGLPQEAIRKAVERLGAVRGEQLDAAMAIMEVLVLYLLSTSAVKLSQAEFISRLDAYIDSNIAEEIRVEALCAHFGVSRTRLYELALPYLGVSLNEYIRRRRMERARQLLLTTDLPVTRVAGEVGYGDYSYFCHVFRKLAGASPTAFRREEREQARKDIPPLP